MAKYNLELELKKNHGIITENHGMVAIVTHCNEAKAMTVFEYCVIMLDHCSTTAQ